MLPLSALYQYFIYLKKKIRNIGWALCSVNVNKYRPLSENISHEKFCTQLMSEYLEREE